MRIAVNSRGKDDAGEWGDKPNFFDVTVFGRQAETVSNYMAKGRRVGLDGRLSWREWEAKDGSGKRQTVEVIANDVFFLDSRGDGEGGGGGGGWSSQPPQQPGGDLPVDTTDMGGGAQADDDIPF
jgi:single-strand DNA-binding protein